MATIEFGFGKDYDWSSTYWSTRTNGQIVDTSDGGTAGRLILAYTAADLTHLWDDTTGWVTANGGSGYTLEINPAGNLHANAPAGVGLSRCAYSRTDYPNNLGDFGVLARIKTTSLCDNTSTSTAYSGVGGRLGGTGPTVLYFHLRKNAGGNFVLFAGQSTSQTAYDTGVTFEGTRYHDWVFLFNTTDSNYDITYDGKVVIQDIPIAGTLNGPRLYFGAAKAISDSGDGCEAYYTNTSAWNSTRALYATSDLVYETDSSNAVFNAGTGNLWKTFSFDKTVLNSTAAKFSVRCAASVVGLSSATYEEIVASGDTIVTQGQYIQVKVEGQDASSGLFTPIVNSLGITSGSSGGMATYRQQLNPGIMVW